MKYITFLLLLIFFHLSAHCQHNWKRTSLGNFNLKGHIKTIEEIEYSDEKDLDTIGSSKNEILNYKFLEFNQNGYLTKEVRDTLLKSRRLILYDSIDRILEYTIYGSNGLLYNHWHYNYTMKNKILEMVYSPINELTSRSLMTLNDSSKLEKIDTYYYKDSIVDYRSIREISYFDKIKTIYTYTIDSLCSYYFQEQGYVYIIRYNDLDQITETMTIKGFGSKLSTFEYDKFGNVVTEKIDDEKTFVTKNHVYEFDELNNWVKKFSSFNGNPHSMTERKINYY